MFLLILLSAVALCGCAQYSSDQCNWRGSGLTHESHARDVEQVYLRCAEGSLEWLYPTGAVIVNLRPNLPSADGHLRACIKPRPDSRGATLYVERAGELRLLLTEEDQTAGRVRCFSLQEGALFVEASARRDISRRITAFQYQLISTQTPGDEAYSQTAACRPCADDELLMAICTSDFVVRGSIQHVEEDNNDEDQASVVLSLSHVYQQKSRVFVSGGGARARPVDGSREDAATVRPTGGTGRVSLHGSCAVWGKRGYDVLHSIKTSSDCTAQLWMWEQTPAA